MIMDKWVNHNFESDIRNTREFLNFARDFKRWLKKDVPDDVAVLDSKPGHFYLSGFLKQDDTNKYIFYSISDVRAFRNKWYNEILIRTAKNEKDFTGGGNHFVSMTYFTEAVRNLFKKEV